MNGYVCERALSVIINSHNGCLCKRTISERGWINRAKVFKGDGAVGVYPQLEIVTPNRLTLNQF